jgi:hypothetical protein
MAEDPAGTFPTLRDALDPPARGCAAYDLTTVYGEVSKTRFSL